MTFPSERIEDLVPYYKYSLKRETQCIKKQEDVKDEILSVSIL